MGFEPTTPGLKVRWSLGAVLEPFPDTESASRGAASRRILSSRTRYVLTRGFYLDPWAACKALVCRQVRCRIMSLR